MATPALRVEGLTYRYPGQTSLAVDGMSFTVQRGEAFGFLGPSGAGKTTAQRAMLGLVDAWQGQIDVLGRSRRAWGRELYDHVGVSFELPVGYPRLTAREDLTHFANLHRRRSRDVAGVLDAVGLAAAVDQPVGTYSKGMRMRLNLARALLHEPEVLFLDEPTAGLDPVNAAEVRALLRAEQARGATLFITTHDMTTAEEVCDRLAFVVDGRIVASDSPRRLRLAHGKRQVQVQYRTADGLTTVTMPLAVLAQGLPELPDGAVVETVHTTEATLDAVFRTVTGHPL